MIKLDNKNISDVYVGDTKIKKIYLNNTVVYNKQQYIEITVSVDCTVSCQFNASTVLTQNLYKGKNKLVYNGQITELTNFLTSSETNAKIRITNLDFSNIDLSRCTNFKNAFNGLTFLTTCTFGNQIVGGNSEIADGITTLYAAFQNCQSLTELDLSNFVVINSTAFSTSYAFDNCINLENLYLDSWNNDNYNQFTYTFKNCSKLSTIRCKQTVKDFFINHRNSTNWNIGSEFTGINWVIVE